MRHINALRWLESSFPARISISLLYYTKAELANNAFHVWDAQVNGLTAQRNKIERFTSRILLNPRTVECFH